MCVCVGGGGARYHIQSIMNTSYISHYIAAELNVCVLCVVCIPEQHSC